MPRSLAASLAVLLIVLSGVSAAEPTQITVRVLSQDAKFVGDKTGGARITVADAETGEILAEGLTRGGTGDTGRIMRTPRARGRTLASEGSAHFTTTIDLEVPRMLRVTAAGPQGYPHAVGEVSSTRWVLPGRHITDGDAWLLELPGFVVEIQTPEAGAILGAVPSVVDVRGMVIMMCGCPTEPDGIWDSSRYEIKAVVTRNEVQVADIDLDFSGETSHYKGSVNIAEAGTYELTLFAYDSSNGNTGIDTTHFIVTGEH